MPDLRLALVAVNATLIALSFAAISCRIGRRVFIVRSFGWSDAFIAIGAVWACVTSSILILSSHYGVGLPMSEVPSGNMMPINKLVMASCVFYFGCNWAIKHSLLLFYAELTIDVWPRRSIYFMHAVAISFGLTCIVTTVFQCWPVPAMWNSKIPGRCINIMAFHLFNSSFMIATDVVLYAMPLVFTWNLQLQRPQRVGLNILFALGVLVLAASGARVQAVNSQITKPDFTYRYAIIMTWGVIENHIAVVVACAPSIKVITLLAFPSLATKFERLLSKESRGSEGYMSSAITFKFEARLKTRWIPRVSRTSRRQQTAT